LGKNKELIRQLGQAGREYAVANFTHEVIAKKFYNFFESLI
jgi:glycosyltransferase involved in cell wall biosynthesis